MGRWRSTLIALERKSFPIPRFRLTRDHSAAPFSSSANAAHDRVHASSEITVSDCGPVFHRTPKAIPPRRDDPPRLFPRHIAQIKDHETEATRM